MVTSLLLADVKSKGLGSVLKTAIAKGKDKWNRSSLKSQLVALSKGAHSAVVKALVKQEDKVNNKVATDLAVVLTSRLLFVLLSSPEPFPGLEVGGESAEEWSWSRQVHGQLPGEAR